MKIAVFNFRLFGINTYIVWDEKTRKCAVIDPGMSDDRERAAIKNFISRENLTVEHLINTHLHVDHAVGNAFISKEYGVGTEANSGDAFLGSRLASQLREFGVQMEASDVEVISDIKNGDVIKVGEGQLQVIQVPGHSPGGVALYDKDGGFLISGDSLFRGSIGRTDLPGGDFDTLVSHVKSRLLSLPPATIVYPGHGDPTTIEAERYANPFLQ